MFQFRLFFILTACILALAACTKKKPDPVESIPHEKIERALERLIAQWDYDNDGAATCADIRILRRTQFKKLDANLNNRLSEAEYRAVNFEDKSFVFYEFKMLDLDASNFIDLNEFTAVSHSEFRGLDKDNDCTLGMRDAAYSIIADRAQGLGGKDPAKEDMRGLRRKVEKLDPFEG